MKQNRERKGRAAGHRLTQLIQHARCWLSPGIVTRRSNVGSEWWVYMERGQGGGPETDVRFALIGPLLCVMMLFQHGDHNIERST